MQKNESRSPATEFIMAVHDAVPGITEAVLVHGCSADGRSSYQVLADAADLREGMTVLDLACGSGALTALIARRVGACGRAVGVDLNAAELALARARCRDCGNVAFLHESAERLSLPDASVDAVLCHLALMLFEPVGPVLAEIGRILRPGGMLAGVVPGDGGGSPEFAALRRELAAALADGVAPERLIALGNREFSDLAVIGEVPFAENGLDPEIEVVPFEVIFRELPQRLAERLTPFFYYSHLLSDEGKRNLKRAWTGILSRTVPAGGNEAVLHLPLATVRIRKK